MGICIDGACGCPQWIITLAGFGGIVAYILLGALIFGIVKLFKNDIEWEWIIFFIILWPIIIAVAVVGAVVYYFGRLITMPIVGADKADLKNLEKRIDKKINNIKTDNQNDYMYESEPSKEEKKEPKKSVKGKSKGKKRKK